MAARVLVRMKPIFPRETNKEVKRLLKFCFKRGDKMETLVNKHITVLKKRKIGKNVLKAKQNGSC